MNLDHDFGTKPATVNAGYCPALYDTGSWETRYARQSITPTSAGATDAHPSRKTLPTQALIATRNGTTGAAAGALVSF